MIIFYKPRDILYLMKKYRSNLVNNYCRPAVRSQLQNYFMGWGKCQNCGCKGYRGVVGGTCKGCQHHYSAHYSTGLCLVTTATLNVLGKGDDCEEMESLRAYRDNWLVNQLDGNQLIHQYYTAAPAIVEAINAQKNSEEIYLELWKEIVQPLLHLIKHEEFEKAKDFYRQQIVALQTKFEVGPATK